MNWIKTIFLICTTIAIVSCRPADSEAAKYRFDAGTPLKKQFLPGEKIKNPSISIIHKEKEFRMDLPLGAKILKDKSEKGTLLVEFPDRRFAAFLTSGMDFIDLERKNRVPLIRGLVYEVNQPRDDILIGVQRLPEKGGTDYDKSTFVLFVMKIDYPSMNFKRVDVARGPHLPDENRIITDEDRRWAENHFFTEGSLLYYAEDSSGKNTEVFDIPF